MKNFATSLTSVSFFVGLALLTALSASGSTQDDARSVWSQINSERAGDGATNLSFDRNLSAIAQAYANDMSHRGYFSHVSLGGVDPFGRMRAAHYAFGSAGENLGLAGDISSAHRLIWNDAAHRVILLSRSYKRVGIGSARAKAGTILVEDFSD